MIDGGLTPEEVAALKELAKSGSLLLGEAERAKARRDAPRGYKATVIKNDWTIHEARLHGRRNAFRSNLGVHERAVENLEHAKAAVESTAAVLEESRVLVEEYEAIIAALGDEEVV